MRFFCFATFVALWAAIAPAAKAAISLSAVDSGWYQRSGFHISSNENYIVGNFFGAFYHNWFAFDLSSVTDTIVGAKLRIFNPADGYKSNDATEFYELFDVTSDINDVRITHLPFSLQGIAIYNDLGSGTSYGGRLVSYADNNSMVEVTLNANAIADLNAATGLFGIGGRLTTLDFNRFTTEFSTGLTDSTFVRELVLETAPLAAVPEASTLVTFSVLLIIATGIICLRRWKVTCGA